jgi:hypothetical protein
MHDLRVAREIRSGMPASAFHSSRMRHVHRPIVRHCRGFVKMAGRASRTRLSIAASRGARFTTIGSGWHEACFYGGLGLRAESATAMIRNRIPRLSSSEET